MADQAPSHLLAWVLNPLYRFVPSWFSVMFLGGKSAQRVIFSSDDKATSAQRYPIALLTDARRESPFRRGKVIDAVLPMSLFLKRKVTAPGNAARNLSSVALLNLQRQTPFQLQDVVWLLGARKRTGAQIEVDQWIARKSDLEGYRSQLSGKGIKLRRFLIEGVEEHGPVADYSHEVAPGAWRWRAVNGVLLASVLCFGAVILLYPAWALGPELKTLSTQEQALRSQALDLRPKIDALREYDVEKAAFLDVINRRTRLSEALRELTVALPDTVWLDTVSYTPNRISFAGETQSSAPEIVLTLSRNVHFDNPRLTGSVSKTNTGAERFEITLEPGGSK